MHGGHLINGDGQREVGRYRLLRRLGEGGMAVVHLAHDDGLDREVALKEVIAEYATDPHWTQRFLREGAEDPEIARNAPYGTPVRRLDEAGAAKRPVIRQPL